MSKDNAKFWHQRSIELKAENASLKEEYELKNACIKGLHETIVELRALHSYSRHR